ncbi:CBM96 family carbohydrate-binding protein [Paenibacillus sp. IITD108]|uniref:CBM96 family carbohydrate-binding protein n=1 Tax=Paenibacillus sp. IITD108 TaxID=3116649 RepID=UPI002F3ED683
MNKLRKSLLITLMLAMVLQGFAGIVAPQAFAAEPETAAADTVRLNATYSGTVRAGSHADKTQASSNGAISRENIEAKWAGDMSYSRRSHLEFGINESVNWEDVKSIKLVLYLAQHTGNGKKDTIQVFKTDKPAVSEENWTWNNTNSLMNSAQLIGSGTFKEVHTGSWVEIDVTDLKNSLTNDAKELAIALYPEQKDDQGGIIFYSQHALGGNNTPYLMIYTDDYVDTIAPSIMVTGLTDGMKVLNRELTFNIEAVDNADEQPTIHLLVNGVTQLATAGSNTVALQAGNNVIEISAADKDGNLSRTILYNVEYEQSAVYPVTADTFTDIRSPNNNYNNLSTQGGLQLKTPATGSSTRKVYLSFDLSNNTENYVKDAKIQMFAHEMMGSDRTSEIVNIYEIPDFNETTLTWNNAPANGNKVADASYDRSVGHLNYINLDITSYINQRLTSGEPVSKLNFVLQIENGHDQKGAFLASKENFPDRAARLILTKGLPAPILTVEGIEDQGLYFDEFIQAAIHASSVSSSIAIDLTVEVNGHTVTSNGNDLYDIPLQIGANQITITAKDSEGNVTKLDYTVKRLNPAAAGTYYVDSVAGDDSNDGLSEHTPWKTLDKVNAVQFQPGSMILFKRGSVWNGQFRPHGSGEAGRPIVVDAYGSGMQKPIINGNGISHLDTGNNVAEGAVHLYNVSYWEINNLEVTNEGPTDRYALRAGIMVVAGGAGFVEDVHIRNVYVHNVNSGADAAKFSGGILFKGDTVDEKGNVTDIPSGFNNISVEDSHVKNVAIEGIRTKVHRNGGDTGNIKGVNNIIRNNLIEDIYGDGVVLSEVSAGSVIENNIVRRHSNNTTSRNYAGLWLYQTNGVIIQYNEVSDGVNGYNDGEAFDFDIGATNNIYQYNYSNHNRGGFLLTMTSAGAGNIFRYNVSKNDGQGTEIFFCMNDRTSIYNNTIYVGKGVTTNYLINENGENNVKNMIFKNNLILVDGEIKNYSRITTGHTAPNVSHNLFYPASVASLPGSPASYPSLMTADPKLTNPSGADVRMTTWDKEIWDQNLAKFKLQPGSPAIDAGTVINNPGNTDLFGTPLYQNQPDIGAHEYVGTEVEQSEFDKVRIGWYERLTGKGAMDSQDPYFANAIEGLTQEVSNADHTGIWDVMNKAANRTHLWSDLASTSSSAHISASYVNLKKMAVVYSTEGSTLFRNAQLRDDIIGGLEWMYTNRYNENKSHYGNWWDWEIGTPRNLNDVVVLMYSDLTEAQIAKYMKTIDKFNSRPDFSTLLNRAETGANMMDKAFIIILRGVIEKRADKITLGTGPIPADFEYVTKGNGFYEDGSMVYHSDLAYTAGYGAETLTRTADFIQLLNGSEWEIKDPRINNVYDWILNAFQPIIYKGNVMDMVKGRGVSRKSAEDSLTHILFPTLRLAEMANDEMADKAEYIKGMVKEWILSDTTLDHETGTLLYELALYKKLLEEDSIERRGDLERNYVFGGMDRVVQFRQDYAFGISMFSNRISSFSKGNNENLRGWWTGTGMTYLYNDDILQYRNDYWPTVDSFRLAGTTTDGSGKDKTPGEWTAYPNSYSWVGGSSMDDLYSSIGMQFSMSKVTGSDLNGKKSWFLFDDEIVALGAGINKSIAQGQVETIVENRMVNEAGNNALTINGEQQSANLNWDSRLQNVTWAHLKGNTEGSDIGYYFIEPASIYAKREARTGSWRDINSGHLVAEYPPVTRNYVSMAFEHGQTPTDAEYQYVLLPGKNVAQTEAYNLNPDIEVLSNTPTIQAVHENKLGMTGINFWSAGTLHMVRAHNPASVMVKEQNNQLTVSVADPSHNQRTIRLDIARTALEIVEKDPAIEVLSLDPYVELRVNTQGALGGSFKVVLKVDPNAELPELPEGPELTSYLTDDAYVTNGSSANSNFGSDPSLHIKSDTPGYTRKAYVKFDYTGTKGKNVKSAILRLNVKAVNTDPARTISVYGTNTDWSENMITWNNAPAGQTSIGSFTVTNGSKGAWYEIDVTDYVRNLGINRVASFLLINEGAAASKGDMSFSSKEDLVNHPQLVIELEEPAADFTELNRMIYQLGKTLEEADSGDLPGQYPAEAIEAFSEAITAAQEVAHNPAATQQDVDDAVNSLQEALDAFLAAAIPDPSPDNTEPSWPEDSLMAFTNVTQTSLTLTWTLAEDNIGVTKYKVTWKGGSKEVAGHVNQVNINGLKAGTAYTFTVEAADEAGNWSTGGPSITVTTTPSSGTGGGIIYPPTEQPGSGGKDDGKEDGEEGNEDGSEGNQEENGEPNGQPKSFIDVEKHWAEEAINLVASLNIVNGYPNNTFRPDAAITRAEFMVMLAKAFKWNQEVAGVSFTDTDVIGDWAMQAVAQGFERGIITGYTDGSFRPNQQISRAEMAVMLARALGASATSMDHTEFADDAAIPAWARGEIEALRKQDIIQGKSQNKFAPASIATRAEVAVIIVRALGL